MSRIGKQPINIPEGVQASIKDGVIEVSGPKGKLIENLVPNVDVEIKDKEILVSVKNPEDKESRDQDGVFKEV